eukprot:CAMPEP_0114496976 /NCGR_PEP_ID=MMETSP0109-20121206/6062_1 /TAXON_ID=29199 /ORGANISM="Chlorarachnion reptans, Strain CCCM449" /LENGTH=120 /DNA_ID=CAMNT_0001674295 /DNA_START=291 /DNA_END=649 /DNA_ORIENTATION=+
MRLHILKIFPNVYVRANFAGRTIMLANENVDKNEIRQPKPKKIPNPQSLCSQESGGMHPHDAMYSKVVGGGFSSSIPITSFTFPIIFANTFDSSSSSSDIFMLATSTSLSTGAYSASEFS